MEKIISAAHTLLQMMFDFLNSNDRPYALRSGRGIPSGVVHYLEDV